MTGASESYYIFVFHDAATDDHYPVVTTSPLFARDQLPEIWHSRGLVDPERFELSAIYELIEAALKKENEAFVAHQEVGLTCLRDFGPLIT